MREPLCCTVHTHIAVDLRVVYTAEMDDRTLVWMIFVVVAALIVVAVIGILRFWEARVNLSEDDVALERRISTLNEGQANRRPDDEIVRLLRGQEQPIIRDDEDT